MKLIIAGSRHLSGCDADPLVSAAVYDSRWLLLITEVVSGASRGIDAAGERWAASLGFPVKRFPADWKKHGRAAGPRRNREMAAYADALVAIPHPTQESRGTADMIEAMRALGKPVHVHRATDPPADPESDHA